MSSAQLFGATDEWRLLARDLGYIDAITYDRVATECVETRRMLIALGKRVTNPRSS